MHLRFHVNLFAQPDGLERCASLDLDGIVVTRLGAADGKPPTFDAYFERTFEAVLDALTRIPRLDAEPDGFFVLAGGQGPSLWRVSGHLFDFGGALHRVELHGDCPAESFDALLACVGWPWTPLAFELVHEGVALEEQDFRRYASRAPSAGALPGNV
jgi:hypothetical protein